MKFLPFLLFCAAPVFSQTNAAPPFQPQYVVLTGVSYDYYGKSGFAANTELGVRVGNSSIYSYTTLELTATQATIRTGAAKTLFQSGLWNFIVLGDAGASSGSGTTVGSFSAGGFLFYDVGSRVTKGSDHFYIGVGGRSLALTGNSVQPTFEFVLGKGF